MHPYGEATHAHTVVIRINVIISLNDIMLLLLLQYTVFSVVYIIDDRDMAQTLQRMVGRPLRP